MSQGQFDGFCDCTTSLHNSFAEPANQTAWLRDFSSHIRSVNYNTSYARYTHTRPFLVQVWDPEGVVIIPDHYIFTADPRANRNVDILRDFVNQQARQPCWNCRSCSSTSSLVRSALFGSRLMREILSFPQEIFSRWHFLSSKFHRQHGVTSGIALFASRN